MGENLTQHTDDEWEALIAEEKRQKHRAELLKIQKRLTSEDPKGQSRRARDDWMLLRGEVERGDDGRMVCIVRLWQTEGGVFRERRDPDTDIMLSLTLINEEDFEIPEDIE